MALEPFPFKMRRIQLVILGLALLCHVAVAHASPETGSIRISGTPADIMGPEHAGKFETILSPDEKLTWDVYVPSQYDRGNPPGLLIYISPSPQGRIPREWKAVMEEGGLIWIGANRSGNRTKASKRVMLAVLGLTALHKTYEIDPRRIYLSGFSGGGRVASMMMGVMPELFRGAIYFCGANFWSETTPEKLAIIRRNAYVFITGQGDINRVETIEVFRKYQRAGATNSKLMDLRYLGHQLPKAADLTEAIAFLDAKSAGIR